MTTQLPHLPDTKRLSPLVIRILGGNPGKFTLQGTNTYLVGRGPSRILVDTAEGIPIWSSNLSSILDSEKTAVSQAILTHWHPDHVGGAQDLLSLCPEARIYKKGPGNGTGQLDIEDGQVFETEDGSATLRALHTPGHTTDHMCLVLEEEGAMFTGDNVLGHGTAVFEDLGTYLESLHRMQDVKGFDGRAYPAHGEVIDHGKAKIREYILHRRQREEEVVRELRRQDGMVEDWGNGRKGGGKIAKEIVKVIYKDYPVSLHKPAEGGVVQVLKKLEAEGRVLLRDDEKWEVVGDGKAMI